MLSPSIPGPESGTHEPWVMLGYLRSALKENRRIALDDWLAALAAAELPNMADPAEAAPFAADMLAPDMAEQYSEAALRDICRRAAYDMGIRDRTAHREILPGIARAAADLILEEQEARP